MESSLRFCISIIYELRGQAFTQPFSLIMSYGDTSLSEEHLKTVSLFQV